MLDLLKKISPAHEPIIYLFLLLVAYQLFIQKQPLDDKWLQYISELVLAIGGRQIVKPLTKIPREDIEVGDGRGD